MDLAAIRELIALESAQVDASFEYWLGASFAVVVAAHAGRESMSKFLKHSLSGAYLLFTLGTLVKFWADVSEITHLNALLLDTELDVATTPNQAAGFTRIAMYIVFSAMVTAFVLLGGKSEAGRE
jgi:hypothetical protein